MTTDRDRIVDWTEARDAAPVRVEQPDGGFDLDVVTDPEDGPGEPISWEEFFDRFETEGLAFQYRETDPVESGQAACDLVDRGTIADRGVPGERTEGPGETRTETIGTSDTGEDEPVTYDRVDSESEQAEDEAAAGGDEDTTMSESPRGVETAAFVLDEIYEDPAGLESDPDEEYLVFRNASEEPLDLSGWTVENDAGRSYAFPEGFVLDAGERVTLHSGEGEDTATDLHWEAEESVWDERGDVITVTTSRGNRVLREPYKAG